MELLSTTTGTIGQAGRRGALMITIRVDHPDVFDFINVKKDLKKVNYANISVKITDEFMNAVEEDAEFTLRFQNEKVKFQRSVRARDVWNQLVKAAWQSDEPGLIFWDTIKRDSTTEYNGMAVEGVNPCSEQTLENYGCCCLGSINLSSFVKDAFTDRASIDWGGLAKAAQFATRFLDNVLDYNADKHPLPQQKTASLWSRRVGVGTTGLGDMLIKLGMKYDDEATVEFVDKLFERIKNVIYDYSTDLAVEKGPAPAFEAEKHLAQPFIKRLDSSVREKIRAQGIRNSALTTVPPVGSGSIFVGSSSGVEPVFALYYTRRSKSLSEGEFKVWHPLVKEYMQGLPHHRRELPPRLLRDRPPDQARDEGEDASGDPEAHRHRHLEHGQPAPRHLHGGGREDLLPRVEARVQGNHRIQGGQQGGHLGDGERGEEEGGRRREDRAEAGGARCL